MVTVLLYECMRVNIKGQVWFTPQKPQGFSTQSVVVYGCVAVVAFYAGRMSPRSGLVSNAGGSGGVWKFNPCFSTRVDFCILSWV